MNKTWKHWGMTLLRGFVCVLVLISFLVTMLSFSVKQAVGEREDYRRIARDPALAQELLDYARVDLEAECLFYDLPATIIDEALSLNMAGSFALSYIDAVYDAVFVSGELTYPEVEAARFRTPIAAHLAEEEIENKDAVIDELAAEFAAVTTAVWRMGLNQQLLTPMHRIVTHKWVVRFLNAGPILAGVTALLVGIGLLIGLRRIRRQTFTMVGTLTVGSMILFVPLWLLHRYGLAEKLVLGDSPLRSFAVRWLDSVTAQLYSFCLWVLIAASLLTVLAAVWVVWPAKENAAADEPSEETDVTEE